MSIQDEIDDRKKAMQPWYWWGVPTFTGSVLMFEMLCLIADYLRAQKVD